jgi:hypothetical protein
MVQKGIKIFMASRLKTLECGTPAVRFQINGYIDDLCFNHNLIRISHDSCILRASAFTYTRQGIDVRNAYKFNEIKYRKE